jgi:putative peptidoglycan lipid II flippase
MILVLAVILAGATAGPRESGLVLVTTVLAAGLVQLLLLWFAARRSGFVISPRPWDVLAGRIDPGAWSLMLRILPAMIVAGSGHVHMVVASQTASFEPRIVSMLYFADRLFQLPLGFVASAIGVVLLPHVARGLQHADGEGAARVQTESIIFASLLIFPSTLGLWILAEPIVAILFGHGAFLVEDARHTARILQVLVLALPAFVLIKVVLPSFLAREELVWPLLAAALALVLNGLLASFIRAGDPILAAPSGVVAGVWVNALLLLLLARGRLVFLPRSWWRVAGALFGAIVMGWCIQQLLVLANPLLAPGRAFGLRILILTALCLTGVVIFAGITRLLRVYSLAAFRRQTRSR